MKALRALAFGSIRARVTALFALAAAALMFAIWYGYTGYSHRAAERNARILLQNAVRKMEEEVRIGGGQLSREEFEEEKVDLIVNNLFLAFMDKDGKPLYDSRPMERSWKTTHLAIGDKTLFIGFPWGKTEVALHANALFLAQMSVLVVVAVSIGAWLMVGRTLSPIQRLSQQAQEAGADSLHLRLEPPSQDAEVVQLVTTLNGMLERLEENAASRGRFYAAASHELRTPLQGLSGHLELALRRPRSNEEYRASTEEAYKQTLRLISLVQDLLVLNQIENTAQSIVCEPVDLAALCRTESDRLTANIRERNLTFEIKSPHFLEQTAPPNHVEMLLRNLITNAVKYATPGGKIRAQLEGDNGINRFRLFNDCSPLSESDLERLCEPFYRPDVSRSSETGGNGLGLAICKAIADANRWDLNFAQSHGGLEVTVSFAE